MTSARSSRRRAMHSRRPTCCIYRREGRGAARRDVREHHRAGSRTRSRRVATVLCASLSARRRWLSHWGGRHDAGSLQPHPRGDRAPTQQWQRWSTGRGSRLIVVEHVRTVERFGHVPGRLARLHLPLPPRAPDASPDSEADQKPEGTPRDVVLLILLDERFKPRAIYEAERGSAEAALLKPGSRARNERDALAVAQFRTIGRKVWPID
jgi:hypothetical protein